MPFEGTRAWEENRLPVDEHLFRPFKEDVRRTFDLPMLRKVFPIGTVLKNVIIEESGETSFGRQMGSYPILAGIPFRIPLRSVIDLVIVDHSMRSVTALPWPVPINDIPAKVVKWIPGLTKSAVARILAKRPFSDHLKLEQAAGILLPDIFTFTSHEVPSF